ncbi:hypothetical protein [Streptomyces sp. NPDC056669]|uniref:hypothetical protein n=1 Tax=unclassified Streptomyces TaxID=2593676 RepID=UPI0036A11C0B
MSEELNTRLMALYMLINDQVVVSRACRGRQPLLSATPVPCGMPQEMVKRSELAGLPSNARGADGRDEPAPSTIEDPSVLDAPRPVLRPE